MTVGSHGGNVRELDTARELQATVKAKRDWSGAIDEQIRRTLIGTGYFHADDLDALEVPPEHCNLKGTRAAWFRNRRLMESTDVYRKVSHAAANGRKQPIYRVTPKGRRELTAGLGGGSVDSVTPNAESAAGNSPQPGEQSAPASGKGSGASSRLAPEPALSLLPDPDPETWAA
jgi:hypothetical protein